MKPDGEVTELLNTRAEDIKIADFRFIADKQLLIAPVINRDILIGYTFK